MVETQSVNVKKTKVLGGSFPATYSLLPLAILTCEEAGSDVHAFIKEPTLRRVEHRSEIDSNEPQYLVEGTE